jgi:hypothetical protein
MKFQIILLDCNGAVKQTVEQPLESLASGLIRLNDVAIDLEVVGRRYLFLYFDPVTGKLTLSLRVRPLLGHQGFYANIAEFEAFIELKRLPATFDYKINEQHILKISLLA